MTTLEFITFSQAAKTLRTTTVSTDFQERVRELVAECGRVLEELTKRRYSHRREMIPHDCIPVRKGGHVDGRQLMLRDECQSIVSIVNGDLATLPEAAYTLLPVHTTNFKNAVSLDDNIYSWQPMAERATRAIEVTGIWGWRGSWRTLAGTLSADITNNATSATVSSATGIEAGMMLRLEEEYVLVTAISILTLTLERGINGTTAAVHLTGGTLARYVADELVQRVIKRMVRWYDTLEDNPLFATMQTGDITVPVDITAMPKDLQDLIKTLRRPSRIKAVN